ncbi:uncharacterized protein LOC108624098 [Ceratina calcarata]|uniref:Uncharacterized protein LOC108624098 n=1 Tax=Ceratina calcarata TaxID=156304 RepID=A0AAJ7IWA0_9HYME|nr:uncharacterized protein LOC108624098 [Ceratina calcarata]
MNPEESVQDGASSQVTDKNEIQAHEFRNVKLPAFWREEPRLWFILLEREFAAYTIRKDAVKSSAVLRDLDVESMKLILDVLESPTEESSYENIKKALIERLEKSEEAKLCQLLTGVELGSKKPSELLREMTRLAGASVSEKALRTLWIQRLPNRIQEILAIIDDAPMDRLAKMADKTMERAGTAEMIAIAGSSKETTVNSVSQRTSTVPKRKERIRELYKGKWSLLLPRQIPREFLEMQEPLLMDGTRSEEDDSAAGKLISPSQIEALLGHKKCRLIIRDIRTKIEFLVDTGADVSVLLKVFGGKNAKVDAFKLYVGNGTAIDTFGEKL